MGGFRDGEFGGALSTEIEHSWLNDRRKPIAMLEPLNDDH
jgi:hypothetical protein